MINAVLERCAGIDIGKRFLMACVMVGPADGEPRTEIRKFGTTVSELERLKAWLQSAGCTHAVMESTGAYWKPVFNVLEGTVIVILANAQEVKARKRHKTDPSDSAWLAHLLRHAMIRPSFIPPREIRELRELTRRRKQLLNAGTAERNRLQKVLEEANVKIGSVLSDVFGVTGQAILEALLEGKASAEEMAHLARGLAKRKIPQLIEALRGHRLSDAHRFLIEHCLQHMGFLEQAIEQLEARILQQINRANLTRPFELLQTIPAIKQAAAAAIVAEIGSSVDPSPHPRNWLHGLVFVPETTRAPTKPWARIAPRETSGSEPLSPNAHGQHPCRRSPAFRSASSDYRRASADGRPLSPWLTPCLSLSMTCFTRVSLTRKMLHEPIPTRNTGWYGITSDASKSLA